jgi:chromosome segregation ATPase
LPGLEKNIERLHDSWDGDEEDEDGQARYQELTETLEDLNERRKSMREKVEGYKRLKELLEPFERATETVQPNLVARDGELEKELEKMRLLVARVRGRVEALPEGVVTDEEMDVDFPDEGEKVTALF